MSSRVYRTDNICRLILCNPPDVCMVITYIAEHGSTGKGCQFCSWSAEQGKCFFPCPSSRLRIWSREIGSAVPSGVSLLILHTQAECGAYSQDSSRFPLRRPLIVDTAIRHRVSSAFIRSRNAYRWRSLPRVYRHRASNPQVSSSIGCCLLGYHHGSIFVRLSFPTPHCWYSTVQYSIVQWT